MKKYFFALIVIALISCRDLGKLVDKEKSNSYFINSNGQILFCQNGNWFELGIDSMKADAQSFKVLSDFIAEDKNFVYYRGNPQKKIDRNSFYIDKEIPKDRLHAYYIDNAWGFEIIDGADPKTYEGLKEGGWSRDKDHYFLQFKKVSVDRNTFLFINQTFSEDKDSIYITPDIGAFQSVLPNKGNAKAINERYIRIGNNVYYVRCHPDAELKESAFDTINKIRVIDNDVICVNNEAISYGIKFKYNNVDVNSLQLYPPDKDKIQEDQYLKDKDNVYYNGEIITNADVKTYTPLGFGFGKDAKSAYYQTELLKGVDAQSFRATGSNDTGKFEFRDKLGNRFDYGTGKKL